MFLSIKCFTGSVSHIPLLIYCESYYIRLSKMGAYPAYRKAGVPEIGNAGLKQVSINSLNEGGLPGCCLCEGTRK